MNIFISHIHEEYAIAQKITQVIKEVFADSVNVFLSENIQLGDNWFNKIQNEIKKADIILVLFSPYSFNRPWINIEAGYGIMSNKKMIPVLIRSMKKTNMPIQYSLYQSVEVVNKDNIIQLFSTIARGTDAKRVIYPINNAVNLWLKEVATIQHTLPISDNKQPGTIWFLGSNRGLNESSKKFNVNILNILTDELIKRNYRIVMGTSSLLNTSWNNIDDFIKNALVASSVRCSKNDVVRNPIVLLGSLRSEKGIRNTFYDSIGTVPQIAIMIGGANNGRTLEEYELAVKGNIPVLPLPISPGLSSSVECTLSYDYQDDITQILYLNNQIDKICEITMNMVNKELSFKQEGSH